MGMAGQSLLLPLEFIKPSEILARYSEWVYFALMLAFFLALAGIVLRRYYEKPYVRTLVIAVGLLLTVAVFRKREALTMIFEGWGSVGLVLLIVVVAVIPFGLARGFGLGASKAFFLTYALMYIIAWLKFSSFFYYLGDNNFGLINLGLLILFIVSIWQVIRIRSGTTESAKAWLREDSPQKQQVKQEAVVEDTERRVLQDQGVALTEREIKSLDDIEQSLLEIEKILRAKPGALSPEDKEKIAAALIRCQGQDEMIKVNLIRLQRVFARMGVWDLSQMNEKKQRLKQAKGQEKKLLQAEIKREEEKIIIEQTVRQFENRMNGALQQFEQSLAQTVQTLRQSSPPKEALTPLSRARSSVKAMKSIASALKDLEVKLISNIKEQKRMLEAEKIAA